MSSALRVLTNPSLLASANLYFPPEDVDRALAAVDVRRALASRRVPIAPLRSSQRLIMKAGVLDYERNALGPIVSARRNVMGEAADGPPKFLVRVDEFPHYLAFDEPRKYGLETANRFHEIMAAAGVKYLLAVVPQLTASPMDPEARGGRPLGSDELEHLRSVESDGVVFAQHGTTHRTRDRNSRRHSELSGLGLDQLASHLDDGLALLAEAGIQPQVFVPPFNRFDATQWPVLEARYRVVCGGPETVRSMGFQASPLFRGDAVYMPAYPPYYGTAREIAHAVERLIARGPGVWVPVTLHLGWEADHGWSALEHLASRIAPYSSDWREFLSAVESASIATRPSEQLET